MEQERSLRRRLMQERVPDPKRLAEPGVARLQAAKQGCVRSCRPQRHKKEWPENICGTCARPSKESDKKCAKTDCEDVTLVG